MIEAKKMLAFHPASEIFELIEGAEFDALVENIAKHGLINEIWLHPDGSILDGRNRYRACLEAGVEPRFQTWDGIGFAADFVWSLNATRRHLEGNARKIAAAKYAIELEREGEERRLANLRKGVEAPTASNDAIGELGRSREIAAEKFNESAKSVERAVKVVKDGAPELIKAVERGDVSVSAAADVATLPKQRQAEIVARGEREILEAAKAIRQGKAEARRAEIVRLKEEAPALPDGQYGVIVIDPPWQMEKIERDVRPNQVAFDYPTMDEQELAAFGVPTIAGPDCHLYCWTTHKHLPMALRLIEAWGFRYVMTHVWHKPGGFQPIGLPQYNCEFVVYARKGSPKFVDTRSFFACFEAPRREHSRKPDAFYDIIRRVTDGPRIDVFSRESREGFDQFGNESDKFSGVA
jgi:N6-adenosine-specific RNA methylase IME4